MRAALARAIAITAALAAIAAPLTAQKEVVERDPGGKPKARYKVDGKGRKHGSYVELGTDGKVRIRASYKAGLLHGTFTVYERGKVISSRRWKHGELVELDGMQPFPRSRDAIRKALAQLTPPARASGRERALLRLKAHRYLAGSPWRRLALDRAGMDGGGGLTTNGAPGAATIDAFLHDPGSGRIPEVRARRVLLDPRVRSVDLAQREGVTALRPVKTARKHTGWDLICHPARGYMPVSHFAATRLWSVSFHPGKFSRSDMDHVRLKMFVLDERYVRTGEAKLHTYQVADERHDGAHCILFRPYGLKLRPGERYEVVFAFPGKGKVLARYLVELISGS